VSSNEQKAAVQQAVNDGAVPVTAWWNDSVWQYSYVFECDNCGKRHIHGGGSGKLPDMNVGDTGSWSPHCLSEHDSNVTLVLGDIVSR